MTLKILVLCEESGKVTKAFADKGHDVASCDLLATRGQNIKHFQCDCRILDYSGVDIVIAFPPCTHLAVSGARWFKFKEKEQKEALEFVKWIWNLPVKRIAIENPIGILSRKEHLGKPSQIIQPWQFGHGETKATCLWLKNLPRLKASNIVEGRLARVHRMPPSKERSRLRSETYSGIANAIAEQWNDLP